ncbi:hypothetical protein HanIR_Chr09g0441091 [Helianthus annuus]|nr:hypothetical protein HanIR_Chr09g0441091 [Helianthus annuus]
MTPCGNLTDRSASCMLIFVGLVVPKPSLLNIDEGMRLMLAPKSAKALRTGDSPIEHGIVKLPGSIFFWGSLLSTRAEHSSPKLTNCKFSIFFLCVRKSLINLEYLGIWVRTSIKGILTCNCFSKLSNFANCSLVF